MPLVLSLLPFALPQSLLLYVSILFTSEKGSRGKEEEEEGRGKREEGRGKREEGRGKRRELRGEESCRKRICNYPSTSRVTPDTS
jgi:hypothetical protein